MKNIDGLRKDLCKMYDDWNDKIFASTILTEKNISLPYYIYLPNDWTDSKLRILIVGEEGRGRINSERDRSVTKANIIEILQEFNKNCMFEWKMNRSPFWRRLNGLRDKLQNASFCWTNIDKVHRLIDAQTSTSCKLTVLQRNELHRYPILQAEIDLIQPTHVIFFGWYGYSLQTELSDIYYELYKEGKARWIRDGYCTTITATDGRKYIFTYHPGWCVRHGQEKDVSEKILRNLQN